ncbi:MAG: fibronectin type III domain-containing protein, partial [Flavobacterium sp.]|nr:fibronectin type III domain-containing protein [Flavobacterium sp.]
MKTKITFFSLLAFLFFIPNVFGQCTTGSQYPDTTYTPNYSGSQETINTDCWAGEYALVNITSTNYVHTFSSSTTTDFITITSADGTTVYASGASPVTWTPTVTGTIRYYIHLNASCTTQNTGRIRYINTALVSTCGSPSGFAVSNITSNSCKLSWTAPATAPSSGYDIYVGTINTTPTAATAATGTTGTNLIQPLSGLNSSTTYYYWVRSNCGTSKSAWVSGGSFTTNAALTCNGAPYGLYPETTFTPSCTGSAEQIAADSWAGEYSNVNIIAGNQYTFTSSVATDYITITNAAGTVVYASGLTPFGWASGATSGTVRVHLNTNSSCGLQQTSRIKSVTCSASCNAPTALLASLITSTSVKLTWTVPAVAPSSGYQSLVTTNTLAPVNVVISNVTTSNFNNYTNLSASTIYYIWVRSVCGTSTSAWISGGSFTTSSAGGCLAGVLYPSTTFTPSCTGSAETITTQAYGGEYSNVNVIANRTYTFASSVATDYITIANSDGGVVFAYGTTPLTWSSGATSGLIRYFIHTDSGCGTQNTDRVRTISCSTPVACSAPSTLSVLDITSDSVKFNWTAPAVLPSSGYQVYYATTNTAPLSTMPIDVNAAVPNQVTFNGLSANTSYYFWVRSVCGTTTSNWVGGFNFMTIPAATVGCNGAAYGDWPNEPYTPTCSGTAEVISGTSFAGTFTDVNILNNKHYTFSSSVPTDYITITNSNGTVVYASGTTPVIWDSGSVSGMIRYHLNTDAACGIAQIERTKSITCTATVPCLVLPSGLGNAYVTSNSAGVFWTAATPAPVAGYQVYVSISNALPTVETQGNVNVASGQNTAVVANLNADTIYYYYVRSNCGSGLSSWVAGGTFRTIPALVCNGAVYGLSPTTTYTPACSGSAETVDATAWAGEFSRVNVLSGRQYTFSSSVSTDYITVTNSDGTTVYASATTPLQWNSGATIGEVRYYLNSDPSCGTQATNRIKSISCSVATSCTGVSGVNVNSITSSGASINWSSSVVPGNGFDYYISTSNVAPTASTSLINTTSNSVVFTNLPAATTFYYWIRSNCSNFQSAWTTGNFTTLFDGCITGTLFPAATFTPACTGTIEVIANNAQAGQYTNINVLPNKKYTFQSSVSTDYITITNAAGTVVLDTDTQVANWSSGSFTGVVRFYIHTNSSCGTSTGVRSKYIYCQDACPSPTGVNFTNVTVDSVQLNWASGGSAYYYMSTYNVTPTYSSDFVYGGSSTSVSKIVTGLSPNTTYYYWIRKFCTGGSGFSAIVYGGSFTTLPEAACNPPTNVSVSSITSNSAYLNFIGASPVPADDYQYYVDTVNVAPTDTTIATGTFVGSTQSNITGLNPNQTYFYWIRSACSTTSKSAWVAGGSFTTISALSCNGTAGAFGLYPSNIFTPSCSGTAELITGSSWAGEFTNVNIATGKQYTFTSSIATDYITITNDTGNIVYASGTTPLNWNSGTNSGIIRYFIHTNSSCGTEQVNRARSIICGMPIISFVGEAASGWDTDIYLSSTDGIVYTLNNYTLSTGGLKFRQNSNWIINWGNATFPSGTGVQDGVNIPVVACNYDINFNIVTGAYNFISTSSQPVKPTGAATQSFCNSVTLADLVVTGTNIKWYDFATGGNLLASNTVVINGSTYYASQSNGTCESIARLAVTVNINTTALPTAAATQAFCNGATVANLVATGTSLKWYNVPANGSVLSASTILTNGVYYVTQTLNSCESARKAVTVTINTNITPTFTAVAPICSGATLAALPTTSINGITGTWSPALNNTATTT